MSRLIGVVGFAASLALAAPVLVLVPTAGWAQIEEIVVTTRKREESLQDVPIAVTAIGSEQIERQNINSLDDVVKLAPSVQFDSSFGPSDTRVTIRGLSNTRGRSNVAFLIDGIDVTTENLVVAGSGLLANRRLLNDVERIELVKGPQSALYGRAAFAGALSYTTKEPGPVAAGKIGLDIGEDDQQQLDFSYETPVKGLEDVLALRVSGVWWDEDGRYDNSVSGDEVGGTDGWGGAFTTVFTPTDAIKIKARLEYTDEDVQPRATFRLGGGLPEELVPTDDASQDNTWPWIIDDSDPANPTRTTIDANNDGLPDVDPNAYTCRDQGNVFKLYPKSALDADIGVGTAFGLTATGLADFGPGICLPESFGDADGRQVTLSENAYTGQDFDGTDQQTFRASIVATLDTDFGTFASYSGWTNFDAYSTFDQDYQALGLPDAIFGEQWSEQDTDTDQFSQELRFTSGWNGPVQTTFGLQYWEETRKLLDKNAIIFCAPVSKASRGDPGLSPRANLKYGIPRSSDFERRVCNGQNGTVSSWQEYARLLPLSGFNSTTGVDDPYYNGTEWRADTESWSAYLMLEWELTNEVKLTFETRYLNEDFTLFKPAKSSCTSAGFSPGGVAFLNNEDNLTAGNAATADIVCESEAVLNDNIFYLPFDPDTGLGLDWKYVNGSESSSFSTPKVTLDWYPTPDSLVYFFWAQAQKPGGISTVIGGGFSEEINQGRFDSEKLDAWELGTKSSWEFAGFLQANAAFYFQDYTDKQVATQVVDASGQLAPRILNAGGAEVWGVELELTWQPWFAEGLTLFGAYTYLDTEYTDFVVESAALQRAAGNGFCNVVDVDPDPNVEQLTCAYQFAGRQLERTPEHAVVLTGNYTRQFFSRDFDWFVETNATWQDERFLTEDNLVKFDDVWLVDLRLGLSAEAWEVIGYVDNVFDDDTIITGGNGPDFGQQIVETGFLAGFGSLHWFGTLPEPRKLGLRASYRF